MALNLLLCYVFTIIVHYSKADVTLLGEPFIWDDSEAVYQLPATTSGKPKGLVFLAHGCGHSAADWWPVSSTCPSCVGLPMDSALVKEGLGTRYHYCRRICIHFLPIYCLVVIMRVRSHRMLVVYEPRHNTLLSSCPIASRRG
jgi:hypothetical protein